MHLVRLVIREPRVNRDRTVSLDCLVIKDEWVCQASAATPARQESPDKTDNPDSQVPRATLATQEAPERMDLRANREPQDTMVLRATEEHPESTDGLGTVEITVSLEHLDWMAHVGNQDTLELREILDPQDLRVDRERLGLRVTPEPPGTLERREMLVSLEHLVLLEKREIAEPLEHRARMAILDLRV